MSDAEILARVNEKMTMRRKGGWRITDAAIRAQSANYAASAARKEGGVRKWLANRDLAATQGQIEYLRTLRPDLSEEALRRLSVREASDLIDRLKAEERR